METNIKVALVTGGTSGIGEACVKELALEGAVVLFTGRNSEKGKKIETSCINEGHKVEFYPLDVQEEGKIEKLKEHIITQYGKLDILVNNAGIYPKFNPLETTKSNDWEEVLSTNLIALMSVTRVAMPLLENACGTIINIGSVAGMQSFASGQGYAYAASKAAVIQFTRMMAKVYAKKVRINCVCPGVIDTPLYFSLDREKMASKIPIGRVGEAEEIAKVVAFLASDSASYICGAVIPIDGGLTI